MRFIKVFLHLPFFRISRIKLKINLYNSRILSCEIEGKLKGIGSKKYEITFVIAWETAEKEDETDGWMDWMIVFIVLCGWRGWTMSSVSYLFCICIPT